MGESHASGRLSARIFQGRLERDVSALVMEELTK